MSHFVRVTLLVVAATILSSSVKALNTTYSPKCNATLSLFNADPSVSSCLVLQSLFTATRDEYVNSAFNFSATQHNVDYACSPTSPAAACTTNVLLKVEAGLNNDCASDLLHADSSSSLYQLQLMVTFASLYQKMLCAHDSGLYCIADFLQTYVKWPLMYDTTVAGEIGVLGNAVGNITSALMNESSFVVCSSCSMMEYTAVFAVVANILRHSPTISMTDVGLPGPIGSNPSEKSSLGLIDFMNTTMSKQCGRPFLNYTVAVPPPPPPPPSSSSSLSGNRTTSRTGSKTDSETSATATATSSINANSTVSNATVTGKSAATGLQSSVWSAVLAGGIASLAVLLL